VLDENDVKSIILTSTEKLNWITLGLAWGSEALDKNDVVIFLDRVFPDAFSILATKGLLQKDLDKLFIMTRSRNDETKDPYIENLVTTEPDAKKLIEMCVDPDKSTALVMAVQSGSGKTMYATRTVKDSARLKNYQCIYHCLSLDDLKQDGFVKLGHIKLNSTINKAIGRIV
jgi:hypothetical protein